MTHPTFPSGEGVTFPSDYYEKRRINTLRATFALTALALIGASGVALGRGEGLDVTCTSITTIRHDRGNYALTPKITGTLPDTGYIALWADTPNGTDTVLELKDLHAKYPPELARNAGRVVFSVAYNPDSTLSPDSTALPPGTQLAPCPAVDIK